MLDMADGQASFSLRLPALRARSLVVQSFRGSEALSSPFRFDVLVHVEGDPSSIEGLSLGSPASLTVEYQGTRRLVAGVVAGLRVSGTGSDAFRLRLRVVPRLSLLKRRVNSRIFQDLDTQQIVSRVLEQAGVPCRWDLSHKLAKRTYCVQHLESDFDFVSRVLAEDGLFYYFDAEDGASPEAPAEDTVVFADAATYPAIQAGDADDDAGSSPSLRFTPNEGGGRGEYVASIALDRSLRPNALLQRDYDFRRPLLDQRLRVGGDGLVEELDATEAEAPLTADTQLEVYEYAQSHTMAAAVELQFQNEHVQRRFEQLNRRARTYAGTSTCRRLQPGRRFTLEGHQQAHFDQEYALVRVDHAGHIPEARKRHSGKLTYQNRFQCVPADVVHRPPRPRRVVRQVLETAVVVGPAGREVYSDDLGRVKVQFHWDRYGNHDEFSSCWMRTLEPWSGTGWGSQFVPRVGMEVVVGFLGGDEERPVVLGAARNSTHPMPFKDDRISGFRTQSVNARPGQPAYNELSFHDIADQEKLQLRAQRDMETHVGRSLREQVFQDQYSSVGQNRHEEVGGDLKVQVDGIHHDLSMCNRIIGTRGDFVLRAGGGVSLKGKADLALEASNNLSLKGGNQVTAVIGEKGSDHGLGSIHVYGDQELTASGRLTLKADRGIELRCGDTVLKLTPKGIELVGDAVKLGAKQIKVKGDGPSLDIDKEVKILSQKMRFVAENASLSLEKEAKLLSSKINLASFEGEQAKSDSDEQEETRRLNLRVADGEFRVHEAKRYEILAAGKTFEGKTDEEGVIDRQIPKEAETAQVTVWVDEYPTGPTRVFNVRFETIEAPNTVKGAKTRLANLGFYRGPIDDEKNQAFKSALRNFKSQFMSPTRLVGRDADELDADTATKLDEIHTH
ncbi:MAG: type VI secretion system tip protein TssI/VgrG [Polyangiaceae bacterium]